MKVMIWFILGTAYVVAATAFYSVSMRTAEVQVRLQVVAGVADSETRAA